MAKKSTDSTLDDELDQNLEEEVESDEEDETLQDEDDTEDNDEETDDESDESDEEDDDESEEDEDSEGFTKRLTQFKGDTPTEYAKSLEDGYLETSKEGVKLSKENKDLKAVVDRINQLIATNPELAKALEAEAPTTENKGPKDPALAWAEAERDKAWQKDFDAFTEKHPEIETDPKLADELNTQLAVVRDVIQRTEGRLPSMGEGLDKAWKLLGKDDTEENIRVAAKNTASKGKTVSGHKSETKGKVKFSDSQIEVMMEMMSVDRSEAIKLMSKHNS